MDHQISEADITFAAIATLEEWLRGYFNIDDGRQFQVVQVEHDEDRMVVEVRGTQHLPVTEDQFEVQVVVKKVED